MNKDLVTTKIIDGKEFNLFNLDSKDLEYLKPFHRNKPKKIIFLRFILTFKGLYSKSGYSLCSPAISKWLQSLDCKITCQTVRNYLKELDKLDFINIKSNFWVQGSLAKTYIIRDTNLHLMLDKYFSSKISQKQKQYLKNLKFLGKHSDKRLKLWNELKDLTDSILYLDYQINDVFNSEISSLKFKMDKLFKQSVEGKINIHDSEYYIFENTVRLLKESCTFKKIVLPRKIYSYYHIDMNELKYINSDFAIKRTEYFNNFVKLSSKLASLYQHKELDFFVDFANIFKGERLEFLSLIYKKIKLDTSPSIRQALIFCSNSLLALGFADYCSKRKRKEDLYFEAENFFELGLDYQYLDNVEVRQVKITSATTLDKNNTLRGKTQGKIIDNLVKKELIEVRKPIKATKLKKKIKAKTVEERLKQEEKTRLKLKEISKNYVENERLKQEIKAKTEEKIKAQKEFIKAQDKSMFDITYISTDPIKAALKRNLDDNIKALNKRKFNNTRYRDLLIDGLKQKYEEKLKQPRKREIKAVYVERENKQLKQIDQSTYKEILKHNYTYKSLEKRYSRELKAINKKYYDEYLSKTGCFEQAMALMIPHYKKIEIRRYAAQLDRDGEKLLSMGISFGKEFIETSQHVYVKRKWYEKKDSKLAYKFTDMRVNHRSLRLVSENVIPYYHKENLYI